jgi:hypothetical protein
VLVPVHSDPSTKAFIDRFPYLEHYRWGDSIFRQKDCEFADIRHPLRRIASHRDNEFGKQLHLPSWSPTDAIQFGAYPIPSSDVADYKGAIQTAFDAAGAAILANGDVPIASLDYLRKYLRLLSQAMI